MELKIIKEEQNPLFNRKEIITTLIAESLPKRQEVIKSLSEKYSVPVNALRVLSIRGKFGNKEFTINAHIYPSNEERDKYERLTKKEIQAEEKLAEAPVEEKPVETPTEKLEEIKTPTEETIGINPVEEAKKVEEKREEEDKKEKDKSQEEKLNETELQA
jgi:ribosomal protein S24E